MDDRVGFEVERSPSRRPVRWRLPAFVFLLVAFLVVYQASRPHLLVSGQYEGYVGPEFSNDKQHLEMRLAQKGRDLKGDCVLSHNRGREQIEYRARLVGTASGGGFKLKGHLTDPKGGLNPSTYIVFEGRYARLQKGGKISGAVWYEANGKQTFSSTFLGRFKSGFSPKDLVEP